MPLETVVDQTNADMSLQASVYVDFAEQFHNACVEAMVEVFETQVLPAAQALSPQRTGKNRASIAVSFRDRLETGWLSAWIFTQSGYGWLIEHGTKHLRHATGKFKKRSGRKAEGLPTPPRPFIYPALRYCEEIPNRARELFEARQ
jgi:hypothetical protein